MAVTGSAIAGWAGSAAGISTIAGAVVAVYGAQQQSAARSEARDAAASSAAKQDQIRAEQKAALAGKAAQEQRQQIREERVRRARVMQSAENTGTTDSSGELGALGVLSTNLSTNLGFNAGEIARGARVSGLAQDAANFNFAGQEAASRASNMGQLSQFGGSIFNAAGGFGGLSGAIQKSPAGTVDNSIFGTAGSGSRRIAD